MTYVWPDWVITDYENDLGHFVVYPLKPYPHPMAPERMELHCHLIEKRDTKEKFLQVPGSGSLYYQLTDKEAEAIMRDYGRVGDYDRFCRTG